jgi:hypothetical protein
LGFPPFVRQKILHGREQKTAKAAAIRIRLGENLFFEQPGEKLLRQILSLVRVMHTPANIGIQREPILLTQLGKGPIGISTCSAAARFEHDAPVRCGKGSVRLIGVGCHGNYCKSECQRMTSGLCAGRLQSGLQSKHWRPPCCAP